MKFLFVYFISMIALGGTGSNLFAQQLYFENPTIFSDTLNSDAEESYPIYSSKDSTLFFVRTLYEKNTGGLVSGQDIWYSKRTPEGKWDMPKNDLANLNNRGNNAVVGVAADGSTLYVINDYHEEEVNTPGLSVSSRQDDQWTTPQQVSIPGLADKQGNYYSLYVAPTEDVAIISMQNEASLGLEDLFVSLKDSGQWSKPVHLGPVVNTSGFDISPYLSADKKTLFFSSNGHPGYGNADLFATTRLDTSWTRWTKPVNLGDEINSVAFDAYLTITEDNEVFFVSTRSGRSADIFHSRRITDEQRASDLAGRISSRGNYPRADTVRTAPEPETDPKTQALIEETQRLLEEFKKGKSTPDEPAAQAEKPNLPAKTVFFDLNSYELETAATPELKQAVSTLTQNPRLSVRVVGHADDTGGSDYNLKLSIARAQAVKKYLTSAGIQAGRIITFGKGATEPLTNNTSAESRSRNRRVTVEFFTL